MDDGPISNCSGRQNGQFGADVRELQPVLRVGQGMRDSRMERMHSVRIPVLEVQGGVLSVVRVQSVSNVLRPNQD